MTDQQIRLQFGEMNASEMRRARAIVGWHERQIEELKKWDQIKETAVDNVLRILPELNESPSWEDAANNVRTFIDGLKSEQASLRAAADAMATAISSILCPGYPKGCNKPTEFEDRMLRSALASYQATKP